LKTSSMAGIIGNQKVACQEGVLARHFAVLPMRSTNQDWFGQNGWKKA
jgi:hypothetical protein